MLQPNECSYVCIKHHDHPTGRLVKLLLLVDAAGTPEHPVQRQCGGSTVRTWLDIRDLRLVPWCLIDRFQSLAVPRPLACWNWFGVIHEPYVTQHATQM